MSVVVSYGKGKGKEGSCGHERVELYLYSPYGLYGLYRTSVPVQGCTLPTFIKSVH